MRPSSCVTPAGTSNELDVQNVWEENIHTHAHKIIKKPIAPVVQLVTSSKPSKERFRPLKKFGKFGIFSKLSKLSNFPRSTMWKWTSTSRSVLVHFHIVESGKLESLENTPLLLQPWYTALSRLQQGKTRIGQLNLCRMKLPYRQRQKERASRVRRDHKLALRTAFAALILVTTRVVSAAATI